MTVGRRLTLACLGAGLGALTAGASLAATTPSAAPATASASQKKAPPAPTVDPAAVAALGRMSAYLRTVHTFMVVTTTQRDDVDIYGQLITLNGKTTYRVSSPGAFNIYVAEPGKTRHYFYDGKTLTIYDPKTGFYTQVAAPATIRETLDMAAEFIWCEGAAR